jgi:hypothetical protein
VAYLRGRHFSVRMSDEKDAGYSLWYCGEGRRYRPFVRQRQTGSVLRVSVRLSLQIFATNWCGSDKVKFSLCLSKYRAIKQYPSL